LISLFSGFDFELPYFPLQLHHPQFQPHKQTVHPFQFGVLPLKLGCSLLYPQFEFRVQFADLLLGPFALSDGIDYLVQELP
jgi:hypothetical protein